MICLICPTRGRQDKMKRMWQSALQTAHDPTQLRLIIGIDEDEQLAYYASAPQSAMVCVLKDAGSNYAFNSMISALMPDTQNQLFVAAADDTIFATPHWDKALREHYEALDKKAHVFCLRDSRDISGTPHPIITREYVEIMGYAFPPIFMHWYGDTWTSAIAKAAGIFTHLTDYELIHDKPSDRGKCDETHSRPRVRGWHEKDSYTNQTCHHFLEVEIARLKRGLNA